MSAIAVQKMRTTNPDRTRSRFAKQKTIQLKAARRQKGRRQHA